MTIDDDSKQWPRRRSIRIKGYDYSQEGAYFIAICTYKRQCTLGRVVGEEMILNDRGRIVLREWHRSSTMRTEIELDSFIIMPNHIHGIVFIHSVGTHGVAPATIPSTLISSRGVGARGCAPETMHSDKINQPLPPGLAKQSLSSLILGFKTAVTRHINMSRQTPGMAFWQRN